MDPVLRFVLVIEACRLAFRAADHLRSLESSNDSVSVASLSSFTLLIETQQQHLLQIQSQLADPQRSVDAVNVRDAIGDAPFHRFPLED